MNFQEPVWLDVGSQLELDSQKCKVVEFFLDRDERGKWEVVVRLDYGAQRSAPHGRKLVDIPLPELAQTATKQGLKVLKTPARKLRPKRYD